MKFLNWLKNYFNEPLISKEDMHMTAYIRPTDTGFRLIDDTGATLGTYTRARDARRGADRKGLVIA